MSSMKIVSRIEMWLPERLLPPERNAHVHFEKQIRELARSRRETGFLNPVLLDRYGNVIPRHGRILAVDHATQFELGRASHDYKRTIQ